MITVHEQSCPQNHPCPVVKRCPVGALSQVGFGAPQVDPAKCTGCGLCARACPVFQLAASAPVRRRPAPAPEAIP